MDYLLGGLVILFAPVIVFSVVAFWMFIFFWLDDYLKEKPERITYCDIDPFNHPGFIWGKDGCGYVCGIKTAKRNIYHK